MGYPKPIAKLVSLLQTHQVASKRQSQRLIIDITQVIYVVLAPRRR